MNHAGSKSPSPTLQSQWLMRLRVDVAEEMAIERQGPSARLSVCYFTGGEFSGTRLRGVLLPGGGDWADVKSADHVEIDVRALMRTEDGALIYLKYAGLWWTPPGILHKVIAPNGHTFYNPEENYFRTSARFESADPRYSWINRTLAIGVGVRTEAGVAHDFFEIL